MGLQASDLAASGVQLAAPRSLRPPPPEPAPSPHLPSRERASCPRARPRWVSGARIPSQPASEHAPQEGSGPRGESREAFSPGPAPAGGLTNQPRPEAGPWGGTKRDGAVL